MKGNKSFLQWVIRSSRPKRKQLMLDPRLVTSMHCKRKNNNNNNNNKIRKEKKRDA